MNHRSDAGLCLSVKIYHGDIALVPDMSYIIENKDRVKEVYILMVTRTISVLSVPYEAN